MRETVDLDRVGFVDLDEALGAVADFVDFMSPYSLGHARVVAQLVEVAGTQLGLDAGITIDDTTD